MDDGLVETLEETGTALPTVKIILNLFSSLPTFPFYSLALCLSSVPIFRFPFLFHTRETHNDDPSFLEP